MGLHFDFTSEQRMLADSVRGLLSRVSVAEESADEAAFSDTGKRLAEHGVLGVMTPENAGGLGLGLTDALVVSLETGRAQANFPAIETIAAARMLAAVRPEDAARVLGGEEIATCAASADAELVPALGGLRLRGHAFVPFAGQARWLVLPVRRADSNESGAWVTVVDLAAPGVSIGDDSSFDLTYPMSRVAFEAAIEPAHVMSDNLTPMLSVLACGELTGAAEHCFDLSLRHLKERVQFGKPIGANQSLRHRAADDWIAVQGMQAASEYAAACFDAEQGEPDALADVERAAHIAKAHCSAAARKVAEHAVQIHGGIGFTWDFRLHVPLRRILRLASAHGDSAHHLDALADTLLNGNGRSE
jgi:alkylation response protein AidB-like acyl-CoA dehydrogenase